MIFVMLFVAPGDRVERIVGGDRFVTEEVRAETIERLGLDRPLIDQYVEFWQRLARGDLGTSLVDGRSVSDVLIETAPSSARLAFWAVAIEITVGLGIGLVGTLSKRRIVRFGAAAWTALLLAVPVFALGHVLQIAFGVYPNRLGWPDWARLPVQGIGPDTWVLGVVPTGDQWRYLVLPAITLAAVSSATASRLMGTSLRQVMARDFIRGARAKGLTDRQVVLRHGVRNALVPVVTFVGLDLANLFGSAVVTERVFNWQGVGSETAEALARVDTPVILGLTMVLGIVYVAANLVVDIVHGVLDPRVRQESSGSFRSIPGVDISAAPEAHDTPMATR